MEIESNLNQGQDQEEKTNSYLKYIVKEAVFVPPLFFTFAGMISQNKPKCPYQFVVIEGNIGAGKTSLASKISNDYNAKLILERFEENPFLPKFYKNPDRYSFPVELSFLADRYNQLKNELQDRDIFSSFTVADYYFMKSLIFSRNTLASDEFKLYSQIFHIIYQALPKPDLYVFLHLETEKLLKNIKNRGRNFETQINREYLDNIRLGYFEFFKQQKDFRVVVVDTNNIDFVMNQDHYNQLLRDLFEREYAFGVNHIVVGE